MKSRLSSSREISIEYSKSIELNQFPINSQDEDSGSLEIIHSPPKEIPKSKKREYRLDDLIFDQTAVPSPLTQLVLGNPNSYSLNSHSNSSSPNQYVGSVQGEKNRKIYQYLHTLFSSQESLDDKNTSNTTTIPVSKNTPI